ncbi:response regulator transcription factor [Chitinophaga sp.]|uniref:response regulator transcription factor n=1 Tax=Chitinophaga sp. TaxID=1869181 RepID=UPI0031D8FD6B
MNKTDTIRILLADAQPVYREGIRSLLTNQENPYVIQEAGNTDEFRHVLQSYDPDILILDYNPAFFSPEVVSAVPTLIPSCKVIIISSQQTKADILRSLELNVYCYLTKECGKQELQEAITGALQGRKKYAPFIVDLLLDDRRNASYTTTILTGKETAIIQHIASGKANKEIAAAMNLSPHTVHTHRKNIMKKLNVHSAVGLASFAIENNLV